MSSGADNPRGPDLRHGISSADLQEGQVVLGHVDDAAVVLVRHRDDVYGVDAVCTHWGGPLSEGLVSDGTIRCPWHHARFNVRTGEVLGGPALDALTRWKADERDGTIRVTGRMEPNTAGTSYRPDVVSPETIVIVGGGGAGTVAAGELRHSGYGRRLVVIDPDPDASVDRPNLSKAFLSGSAPESWLPLRSDRWWDEQHVDRREVAARRIDPSRREITLADGDTLAFDALILATGAEPLVLQLPGEGPPIHTLRTLADARRLIAAAEPARRVVVLGASFIGLEVAASLRKRDIEVHIVAPETRPLERVFGPELGTFVRRLHEEHGVTFHLERTARRLVPDGIELSDGTRLPADLVVMGVGVRPRVALAADAGLAVDDGVLVNERLETSAPGIYAAGDIARYPDPRSRRPTRFEHWVVAQRQGRTAARNALGFDEIFDDAPFFWSEHYDVPISYVGNAPEWDTHDMKGSLDDRDAAIHYRKNGVLLALATVGRSDASLAFEAALEAEGTDIGAVAHRGVDMPHQINKSIIVKGDPATVFAVLADIEHLPDIVEPIATVERTGDRSSHWVIDGPDGTQLEWDAETTTFEPDHRIAWNTAGGHVKTTGQITVTPLPHDETQVTVTLQYQPSALLPESVAAGLLHDPDRRLLESLRSFKRYAERRRA